MHIARQIAEALDAAHGAGIVHRDLKPENVMLVSREGDPDFVKVLDFGIAKVNLEDTQNQPQLTQVGSVFGTPEYMSPEQAAGQTVDARADLYTLGILLYEMLSGATPFAADDLLVVLTRQMTEAPPPLSQEIPGGVRQVVSELLVKDPLQRTPNAAELVRRIDALGEPEPPRGPPTFASSPFAEPAPSSPGVSPTLDDESGSGSPVAATAPDMRPPMPSSAASPAPPEAAESPAPPGASPAPPEALPSPPAPPVVARGPLESLSRSRPRAGAHRWAAHSAVAAAVGHRRRQLARRRHRRDGGGAGQRRASGGNVAQCERRGCRSAGAGRPGQARRSGRPQGDLPAQATSRERAQLPPSGERWPAVLRRSSSTSRAWTPTAMRSPGIPRWPRTQRPLATCAGRWTSPTP